mmetsp:Transcript_27614/g.81188  ORF Transcript_27614/g.81188 Transcript_27614/m.81188 type:complete len:213 (+) Transcript_27614:556-1194(+)
MGASSSRTSTATFPGTCTGSTLRRETLPSSFRAWISPTALPSASTSGRSTSPIPVRCMQTSTRPGPMRSMSSMSPARARERRSPTSGSSRTSRQVSPTASRSTTRATCTWPPATVSRSSILRASSWGRSTRHPTPPSLPTCRPITASAPTWRQGVIWGNPRFPTTGGTSSTSPLGRGCTQSRSSRREATGPRPQGRRTGAAIRRDSEHTESI